MVRVWFRQGSLYIHVDLTFHTPMTDLYVSYIQCLFKAGISSFGKNPLKWQNLMSIFVGIVTGATGMAKTICVISMY
jgi:hypothetical protein